MSTTSSYTEYGWSDDRKQHYHDPLCIYITKLLPKDGSPILDVGCGNGAMTNMLIDQGYCVYGIDASPRGIEIANRKNSGRFFVNNVTSAELPAPLKGIEFRTVISTEVIEHLYNPGSYVVFIRDILLSNGGGRFIVSTPYHGYLKNLLVALCGRMDYHFSVLWDGGHIKFWSRKTLSTLLLRTGFENLHFKGIGHAYKLWRQMVIDCTIAPPR